MTEDDDLGAEPLLSDAETSALLDAMRDNEAAAPPMTRSVDVVMPERGLRRISPRADACITDVASAARTELLRLLGRSPQVAPVPAEIIPHELFVASLEPTAVRYPLEREGRRVGLLVVSPPVARYVVVHALGGTEETGSPLERASAIDRRVLTSLVSCVTRAAAKGLEIPDLVVTSAIHDELPVARFEPMLRLTLRFLVAGNLLGELIIALTPDATVPRAPTPDESRSPLGERIAGASVELVAVLGQTASSVRELLALEPGDLIRLDGGPERPIGVWVAGVAVGRGAPVEARGNLAVELTAFR